MTLKTLSAALLVWASAVAGCNATKVYERDNFADPIMERESTFSKQTLAQKFFLTREGSIGGSFGISGGCGCAK